MPLPLFVVGAIKIGAIVLGVGGAAIGVRGAVKLKKAKEELLSNVVDGCERILAN